MTVATSRRDWTPAHIGAQVKSGRRRAERRYCDVMVELLRTNDQVIISFAGALLTDAGIAHHVADQHLSVLNGSMGTIQMRVLVADDLVGDARQILADGGLEQHLVR